MIGLIFGLITLLLSFYLAKANIKRGFALGITIVITIICCLICLHSLLTMQQYYDVMNQKETIDFIDYKKMPKEYDIEVIRYNNILEKAKHSVEIDPYSFMKYQRDTINELDYIQVNERN